MTTISDHSSEALSRRRRTRAGVTLPELLMGMAVSAIAIAAFISAFLFMTRSAFAVYTYAEMNAEGRRALSGLGEDLRAAVDVMPGLSPHELTVSVYGESGLEEIAYTYDPSHPDRPLTRTFPGHEPQVIMHNIGSFSFFYFDLQGEPAETAAAVKQIQVRMHPARKTLGLNQSQDLLSARFMLRNKHVTN